MNRKALGPVIAIFLLVIVSVVAVIGFQSWFQGYESKTFSDVEIKSSNSKGGIDIHYISNDGQIYILNTLKDNYTIFSIQIDDFECDINENLTLGINNLSIKNCLNSSGVQDIVIFGEENIVQEKVYLDISDFNLNLPSPYSVPTDNLFAFYTFNNISGTNLYEEIGDYHGVMYNTPTQVTGKYGQALKFDSTQTEYVLLPDAIGTPLTNDYSVSFWVYYDVSTNTGLIFRTSVTSGLGVRYDTHTYRAAGGWYGPGSTGGHILDDWNHLVMIKSSINGTIIYLNGIKVKQNSAQTVNNIGESDWDVNYFGRDIISASYFNGMIDNFRIYTKELNQSEILGLYYE